MSMCLSISSIEMVSAQRFMVTNADVRATTGGQSQSGSFFVNANIRPIAGPPYQYLQVCPNGGCIHSMRSKSSPTSVVNGGSSGGAGGKYDASRWLLGRKYDELVMEGEKKKLASAPKEVEPESASILDIPKEVEVEIEEPIVSEPTMAPVSEIEESVVSVPIMAPVSEIEEPVVSAPTMTPVSEPEFVIEIEGEVTQKQTQVLKTNEMSIPEPIIQNIPKDDREIHMAKGSSNVIKSESIVEKDAFYMTSKAEVMANCSEESQFYKSPEKHIMNISNSCFKEIFIDQNLYLVLQTFAKISTFG